MKGSWKLMWFSSAELQLHYVNNSVPPDAAEVQFIFNPWRFWAPYGLYFRSAYLVSRAIPDMYRSDDVRYERMSRLNQERLAVGESILPGLDDTGRTRIGVRDPFGTFGEEEHTRD